MKLKAINEQKKIISDLKCFASENAINKEIKKLNLLVDDFEKDNTLINKDNISLYYGLMSFDDILINIELLNTVFFERYFFILSHFKEIGYINEDKNTYKSLREWEQIKFKNKHIKKDGYKYYEISFFDIKDTLKPINIYIQELKESEQYKTLLNKDKK